MADKSKETTYRYEPPQPRLKGIDDNDSWLDPEFLEAEALFQLPPTASPSGAYSRAE